MWKFESGPAIELIKYKVVCVSFVHEFRTLGQIARNHLSPQGRLEQINQLQQQRSSQPHCWAGQTGGQGVLVS